MCADGAANAPLQAVEDAASRPIPLEYILPLGMLDVLLVRKGQPSVPTGSAFEAGWRERDGGAEEARGHVTPDRYHDSNVPLV